MIGGLDEVGEGEVHSEIDGIILFQEGEAVGHVFGVGNDAADVEVVEYLHSFLIFRGISCSVGFVFFERVLDVLGEEREEFVGGFDPEGHFEEDELIDVS